MEICKLDVLSDDHQSGRGSCVDVHRMRADEEDCILQLISTTNEFNLTTKRYSQGEIHGLAASEEVDVIVVEMKNKSGEKSLISVMILKYGSDNSDAMNTVDIDQCFISCHVMNRGLKKVIIQKIAEWLKKERPGIKRIRGHFTKTDKNKSLEELYDDMGFIRETDGDLKMYVIRIEDIDL